MDRLRQWPISSGSSTAASLSSGGGFAGSQRIAGASLAALENVPGVWRIAERTTRRMALTYEGEEVPGWCRRMWLSSDDMEQRL